MKAHSVQKCRTCLRNSANSFSLKKLVADCSPEKTYGQLLAECAKLEGSADYENLMPQYICHLCCRDLKISYSFIKQARKCNNKLLNVIAKKFECLQENIIDVPAENQDKLKKSLDIKEIVCNIKTNKTENDAANGSRNKSSLEKSESNEKINNDEKVISSKERNESADVSPLKTSAVACEINAEERQPIIFCLICEKTMDTYDDLKMHMRVQHDTDGANKFHQKQRLEAKKIFDCKLCSSKYSNRYSYIYHLLHKHNIDEREKKEKLLAKPKTKIIKCRSCDYTARTYAALHYHSRAKHGTESDKFKCKFCTHLCVKKFDLFTHIKNVHKELIKSLKTEAENSGEIREALSEAKTLTLSKPEPVEEDNSAEEFCSDDNIPLATRANTTNPKTNLIEDEEQFSDEDFIRNILNIKKRQKKSSTTSLARKCDECGNIYKNQRSLYAHQKHVHISQDKYSLCPHCGKRYKRKTDLRIHVERDHIPKTSHEIVKQPSKIREKRFMCTECSYVCATITILNIHINRKHTGEKPYKCDVCFKSFLVPYDLKIHRYLHTGERPYKCSICFKGFRDNAHMVKHKRIHSNERPFKCKECGKGFALSYYLSVHNRTHLKEKQLNCITCGKVFQNRSLLNLHRINENHQDEIV